MSILLRRTPSPRQLRRPGSRDVLPDGTRTRVTGPGEDGPRPVWAALCPLGTVTVPWSDAARVLPLLAPGTPVAVLTDRPFARRALRRECERHGVQVGRELVAVPSASRPLVLFDDHPETVATFWNGIVTVPPAPGWITAPATLVLTLGARAPWRWTGALTPGRILLGVRR